MHTEAHSTHETRPQIGDLLRRECGVLAIVEHIDEAHIMHVRLLHSPNNWEAFGQVGDGFRIPTELIGISWAIIA